MASRFRAPLTLAALVLTSAGWASGADGPLDYYVSRDMPDEIGASYTNGRLGLLLPTWPRWALYPAWRVLASADAKLPLKPLSPEAVRQACCDGAAIDLSPGGTSPQRDRWIAARAQATSLALKRPPEGMKPLDDKGYAHFLNCPPDAFRFAADTLEDLRKRGDANPARLQAWVQAQDLVFEQCGPAPGRSEVKEQPPERPKALPASEAAAWRQAREYQIASAAFYAGDWPVAQTGFHRIAADAAHPWRAWSQLALLRTALRQASLQEKPLDAPASQALWMQVQALAQPLLALDANAPQHRAAQQALALAEARLMPDQRWAQLSRDVARLDAPPEAQAYTDWVRLSDLRFDNDADALKSQAAKTPTLDWMTTLQGCRDDRRAAALSTALQRWRAQPGSLWLVATLSCADGAKLKATPEWTPLLKAVDKFDAQHPATPTLRWQRLRLLREAGDLDAARAALPGLQSSLPPSASARNLVRAEGLALARTLDEVALYLGREPSGWRDADTGATGGLANTWGFDEDGLRLLQQGLSTAQWEALSRHAKVPDALKTRLTLGAWWRAEWLGQHERAVGLARQLLQRVPALKPALQPYIDAPDAAARRMAAWRASLGWGLPALPEAGTSGEESLGARVTAEDAVASGWCQLGQALDAKKTVAPQLPLDPALNAEQSALRAVGTATGAYSRWLLDLAKKPDAPKDLDWLLYVGVQSTRGGCVDPDNGKQSRTLHGLLHQKFPKSPWAKKAPYWYR